MAATDRQTGRQTAGRTYATTYPFNAKCKLYYSTYAAAAVVRRHIADSGDKLL